MTISRIKIDETTYLERHSEGYTLFSTTFGIPLIITDAPFERLKQEEDYAGWIARGLRGLKIADPDDNQRLLDMVQEIESMAGESK